MIRHDKLYRATFVERPNRFIVRADLDGAIVTCHMPNPGRLWELLFPETSLMLRKAPADSGRKTSYDVIGVFRDDVPVLMDTQYNNDVASALIARKLIPGWESWSVLRREVAVEGSRFDLLLHRDDELFFVEVKSCTLFGRTGAMFPDAVTERGKKHLLHLAALQERGYRTGLSGIGRTGFCRTTTRIRLLPTPLRPYRTSLTGRLFPLPGTKNFPCLGRGGSLSIPAIFSSGKITTAATTWPSCM